MASTPTGPKSHGRKAKSQMRLRRRILEQNEENDSGNPSDEEESSPDESGSGNSSSTVEFDKGRYSLRENSENVSLFYKSILTPSRLKRRSKMDNRYRTPKLKPTKRDYSITKATNTPQIYKSLWKEHVDSIIKKSWKVCYLSTMKDFDFSRKTLKAAYLRTLKIRILDEYPSYHLTVSVTPSSFLYQNVKRTDSLFIKVTSLSLREDTEEEELRTIYEAMLVRSKNTQSLSLPGMDWFPLMLYTGLELVHNVVIRWLQSSFGCYITPKGLNAASVLWLAAVWTHGKCSNKQHALEKDRKVYFHYYASLMSENPKYRNEKGLQLKLTLKTKTVLQIWNKVVKKRSEHELSSDDVASFHRKVETILYYMTRIPRNLISLQAVQTTCNTISRAGRIRITCGISFHSLLQHLVESFESICHFHNFDNEVEENRVEEEEQDENSGEEEDVRDSDEIEE